MGYASFLKRVAASIIDGVIYGVINWFVSFFVGIFAGIILGAAEDSLEANLVVMIISVVVSLGAWAAYYAWPESSSWQATIGKKIFGLRVTDMNGQRVSFWRAVWRNFAKFFSAIILGIGYLMCIWTEKKQCLHDMMSNCLMLDETPNEKQGCAWAVIAAYFGLLLLFILAIVLGIGLLANLH